MTVSLIERISSFGQLDYSIDTNNLIIESSFGYFVLNIITLPYTSYTIQISLDENFSKPSIFAITDNSFTATIKKIQKYS